MRVEVKVEQGVHLRVDHEDNTAATAAVASVGTAEGLVLLPVHRCAPVAAVACADVNDHAVDEAGQKLTPVGRRERR